MRSISTGRHQRNGIRTLYMIERKGNSMKHISELLEEQQPQNAALKSGLDFIDNELGGYHPGELMTICGMENSGKTAFILSQIDRLAVEQGIPTLVGFGMMDMSMAVSAMMAYHYDIETNDLWNLLRNPRYKEEICEYKAMLSEAPLFVLEDGYCGENWERDMVECISEREIRVAFFDEFETYTSNDTSAELKRLATQSNIPIIKTELIWRDRDGGERPISLSDMNMKEHHIISSMSDTVIAFNDYEFMKIFTDERGISLRGVIGIEILKQKGLIGKKMYRLLKKRLLYSTRFSDSKYDVPVSQPIVEHI